MASMISPQNIKIIAAFVAFSFVSGFLSYQFLRDLLYRYHKLETNHNPRDESIGTKVMLLFRYNIIVAAFGVVLILLYSLFIDPVIDTTTLSTLAATAILIVGVNIIVRLASYAYADSDPEDIKYEKSVAIEIKERLHDATFSFYVGLWALLMFAIGINIITGQSFSTNVFPSWSLIRAFGLSAVVLLSVFILSLMCEIICWIWPLSVPEFLQSSLDE